MVTSFKFAGRQLARLAAVLALALPIAGTSALAWDGYGHHHGSRAFFSFSFGYPSYGYYAPYAYAPVYAYPPYDPYDGSAAMAQEPAATYCREFQSTIVIDGRQQPAYGVACRQPDGSWAIMGE